MNKEYVSIDSPMYWAFNIWNLETANAVLNGAVKAKKSVIIQTSMKAFQQLDKESLRYQISNFNKNNKVQAYLHLDHCRKLDMIEHAIECGWDSVMIDASEKDLEENIKITNEVCRMAKEKEVLVEAEIGKIHGVEENIISEEEIANIEDVKCFLSKTNIDMIAVAIGTAHGKYSGIPQLHFELIDEVWQISNVPLVIHGGSGLEDHIFKKLLSYKNVKKINVSTEVKLAYRDAIRKCYNENIFNTDKFDPLQVCERIKSNIEQMVIKKMAI